VCYVDFGVECGAQVGGRHDLRRWAHRHGTAVAQEEDPRCQARRLVEVVHRDESGDPVARGQIADECAQRETMPNIEERGRFVQQQNARLLGERTRERHAPLFTAAQRVDATVGVGDEIAARQGVLDGGSIDVALAHPPVLMRRATHRDDLANAKARRDGVALRYESDITGQRAPVDPRHVSPEASHLPSLGDEQARRHP
jgi:hypothetical protein